MNDKDILYRTQKFASEIRPHAAPSVQIFLDLLLREATSVTLYGRRDDEERIESAKRVARAGATYCLPETVQQQAWQAVELGVEVEHDILV